MSRLIIQEINKFTTVLRDETNLASFGCSNTIIFKDKYNEEIATILTTWVDDTHFQTFLKSDELKYLKNTFDFSMEYEILTMIDKVTYSNKNSEIFSIARTYVQNLEANLASYYEMYSKEDLIGLGILNFNLYTVRSNDRILMVLTNWADELSYKNVDQNDPHHDPENLGALGTDRYSLMMLVDSWSIDTS